MAKTTFKTLPPAIKIYAPFSNYFSIASIFRPMSRGADRVPFEFMRDTETYKLKISGMETLDAGDLDVLLAVLHIAGKNVQKIDGGHPDVLTLQATGEVHASHFDTAYAEFTRHEILTILGRSDSSKSYKALKASLIRLTKVNFHIEYKKLNQWMSSALLSASGLDDKCKIILNRELGQGLIENYSRVWFDERSDLSECGRIMHTFLSGAVREGSKGSFISYNIDTLLEHVYGVNVDDLERRKLSKLRANIDEQARKIIDIWGVTEATVMKRKDDISTTCYYFMRPKR